MTYQFPEIEHIDDVLPAIEGVKEFIVVDKGQYKVINYAVVGNDTFPEVTDKNAAIRRECRGIIFDENGRILSRRLHKFFNLNEREETLASNIDFSRPHTIFDKLDGSMVTPIILENQCYWGTKMGIQAHSEPIQRFVDSSSIRYTEFAMNCWNWGLTPIFEWCTPANRIVIDYEKDSLVLLHIRDDVTGTYWDRHNIELFASEYGVPLVRRHTVGIEDIDQYVASLRGQEGIEGVIVQFGDGNMIKLKTDWYVRIHRSKDLISREYSMVNAILHNATDDLIPLLLEEDAKKVLEKTKEVNSMLYGAADNIYNTFLSVRNTHERKDVAVSDKIDRFTKSMIFKAWDEPEECALDKLRAEIFSLAKKNSNRQIKWEEFKANIGGIQNAS